MRIVVWMLLLAASAIVACSGSTSETLAPASAPEQRGERLVEDRACMTCHAPSLAGTDTARPGTRVYARNLTPDAETGIGGWSDADVVRAIRAGVDDQGQSLCPQMPRFADLSDEDAAAIVAYLRSLPAVYHEVAASQCGGAM